MELVLIIEVTFSVLNKDQIELNHSLSRNIRVDIWMQQNLSPCIRSDPLCSIVNTKSSGTVGLGKPNVSR